MPSRRINRAGYGFNDLPPLQTGNAQAILTNPSRGPPNLPLRNNEQREREGKCKVRTMKPLFVTIHEGRRDVQWTKLVGFSAAVLAVFCALSLGLWYAFTQTLSLGAVVVGLVLGLIVVVRVIARALTYQEQELEVETPAAA